MTRRISTIGGALGTAASITTSSLGIGSHTITATVTDSNGAPGASTITITVVAAPPVASFTAVPSAGIAPLTVQFTDTSTGNITSRTWNLGNGTTITGSSITFAVPIIYNVGTYTVTLTVTGPGGTTSTSKTINALPTPGGGDPCTRCELPPDDGLPTRM